MTPSQPVETTEVIVIADDCFDDLLKEYYNLLWLYEGKKCRNCGVIQGTLQKGVFPYFCRHISKNVSRKLKGTEFDRMCNNYLQNKVKRLFA